MAEYIEFEATKQAIDRIRSVYHRARNYNAVSVIDNVFGKIKEIPAADVAPVVHGHWVDPLGQDPYCSVCGFSYEHEQGESAQTTDYCGECGAKMDGEV